MGIESFDLNLLKAFRAVMRDGSVTAAANSLGMTQPALSRAIQRLRDFYKDPLFVRTSSGMRPTEYARKLASRVDDAIAASQKAIELDASFTPSASNRSFRLVMTDGTAMVCLPRLMRHLKQAAPGVRIVSIQLPRDQYRDALETGAAELALGQLPKSADSLRQRALSTEKLVCLVRKGHPGIDGTLTMEKFIAAEHISVAAPAQAERVIDQALGSQAQKRQIMLSLPHYLAVPAIVSQSDLVAVMPASISRDLARKWNLLVLPLPFDVPAIRMSLFWHERSHHDSGHRWLRETILRTFTFTNAAPDFPPDG